MKLHLIYLFLCACALSQGQETSDFEDTDLEYVGFTVGRASQKTFPFTSNEYIYSTTSIKFQYNKKVWDWGYWDAHILVEPGFYRVDHRLINFYFITPQDPNFEERRERFLKPRTFNEIALNVGIRVSRPILPSLEFYGLVSSGPMYGEETTERLKRGFAFSNFFGAGIQYEFVKNIRWDLRMILRHTSNAGFKFPNSGHNSFGGETGIVFLLN